MRVTIVLCTRGRESDLANTLESLSRIEVPPDLAGELLVVENGEKAGAEACMGSFSHPRISARYLFAPIPGKSRALNLAITAASGDIFLFTDDDVRFPVGWLISMCEPIRSGKADAVAGGVRFAPHLVRSWMNRTHRAWLASTADYLSADHPSEMCGANMAISKRALDRMGGFDPELGPGITGGGEETLLSWQLRTAGFGLASALHLEVEHHFNSDRLKYPNWIRAAQGKGQSRAYLLHHWEHRRMRHPWLKEIYLRCKLTLRRAITPKRTGVTEGISPWELSYVEGIAACARYRAERLRPKNYAFHGLHKLNSAPAAAIT
jgi:GT2 family glycosyltransferase